MPFLKMRELGIRNEMTGSRIIKVSPGGASFRSLRPQICCLCSTLYIPEVTHGMRSPVLCRMTAVPVRTQMKRGSEVASFLPLSLFFHRSAQATPFHLIFTGKRGPVKTLSVRKRKKRIKSPLSSVTASVMVETHSLQAYKNPCKMRVSFRERNFRF